MLDEKNVYAQDSGKNNFLTMTKEQILTAIMQAVSTGEIKDIDAGFITKIQEMNDQNVLQIWVGTMAEFEELQEKHENMLYLFTDDPTVKDIEAALNDLEKNIDNSIKNITKYQHNIDLMFTNEYKQVASVLFSFVDDREEPYTVYDPPVLKNVVLPATGYVNTKRPAPDSLLLAVRSVRYQSNGKMGVFCIDGENPSYNIDPKDSGFSDTDTLEDRVVQL